MKAQFVDLNHIRAMRDRHRREAERYDEMLTALMSVVKLSKQTQGFVNAARARAASHGPGTGGARPGQSGGQTAAFIEAHGDIHAPIRGAEARRLFALPRAKELGLTLKGIESALVRAMKRSGKRGPGRTGRPSTAAPKSGDRAMDRIRAVFASSNGTAMSRADVAELAKLSEIVDPTRVQQSAAKVLAALVTSKEVKATKDGFLAGKLKTPTAE